MFQVAKLPESFKPLSRGKYRISVNGSCFDAWDYVLSAFLCNKKFVSIVQILADCAMFFSAKLGFKRKEYCLSINL